MDTSGSEAPVTGLSEREPDAPTWIVWFFWADSIVSSKKTYVVKVGFGFLTKKRNRLLLAF
jgi:hypothetical protein